jgi:hypothetical protein
MRKQRHTWLLILGVLYSGAGPYAQTDLTAPELASFIGTWTVDSTKSGTTDPERRVISTGAGWMRVEIHRPGDSRPPVLIYNLDGSRNVNSFGPATATTQIRRDGNDIVTVTVVNIKDRPVTVEERLRLTSAGEMAVAILVRVEHGYEGVRPALEKHGPNVAEGSKLFQKIP